MQKGTAVKQESGTDSRSDQARAAMRVVVDVGCWRTLLELAVETGVQVLQALLEEDRTRVCGPRYRHNRARTATRAGATSSEVTLGGQRVVIRRPRVRAGGREVALPTLTALRAHDPLPARVLEQLVLGVATRQYARSLPPLGPGVRTRGTSKSAVSRHFVARTRAQLETWRTRALGDLELVGLMLDGVRFARECLIVALGIDAGGHKHVLGLWEGSTENATVCQALLTNLRERGLRTDRSVLVVLDGSKALHAAVTRTFGAAAWIQRCQVHKLRNVCDYLPTAQQAWVRTAFRRALGAETAVAARRQLETLARQLEPRYPPAAASVREGLDELVTVLDLPVGAALRRSLATTNPIESLIKRVRDVHRNVKRWHGRSMALRWATAGILEAATGFKRLQGARDMRALVNRLRARDVDLKLASVSCAA